MSGIYTIFKNEGFATLYRGVVVAWLSATVSNAAFFYMYTAV